MANKDPIIKINGLVIKYEPNSLMYQKGKPERKYYPQTDGSVVQTEDLSDSIGKVKFSLRSTDESEKLFNEWIDLGSLNAITVNTGDFNKSYSGMSIANPNVEIERGSDSTFDVIFCGNPVSE